MKFLTMGGGIYLEYFQINESSGHFIVNSGMIKIIKKVVAYKLNFKNEY